jgi:hypothetical protein
LEFPPEGCKTRRRFGIAYGQKIKTVGNVGSYPIPA